VILSEGQSQRDHRVEAEDQRCHSKKIKKPRWANKKTKKTQGQIYIDFAKISGKNTTFPLRNPTFSKTNF